MKITHRTREPLVEIDKPWEESQLNYCSVLRFDGLWHMWYLAYDIGSLPQQEQGSGHGLRDAAGVSSVPLSARRRDEGGNSERWCSLRRFVLCAIVQRRVGIGRPETFC